MALPIFQATGAWVAAATGTISPAWPTHLTGDVGILLVYSQGLGINLRTPQGFKEFPVSPRWAGPLNGSPSHVHLNIFWCRATSAAMAAPVIDAVSVYGGAVADISAIIFTIRDVGTGNPWNALAAEDSHEAAAGTNYTVPGFTTTDPDCLVVDIVGMGGTGGSPEITAMTNASLTGYSERLSSTVNTRPLSVYAGAKAAAGVVNATSVTTNVDRRSAQFKIAFTGVDKASDNVPYIWSCGQVVESAVGNISPAWPIGHQAGDIGILLVQSGGYPITLGTPAGFVELPNSPQSSGPSGNAGITSMHAFWKRATGAAEAAPTVDFHTDNIKAAILVIREAPSSGNFWEKSAADVEVPATTSVSFPSVTPTKPNSLILHLMTHGNDSTSRTTDFSTISNAALENRAFYMEMHSNIGSGAGLIVARGILRSPGPTGNTTATMDGGQQQARMTLSIPSPEQIIAAEGGSFGFTGQVASLLVSRKLTAEQGLFSFTGQDSTPVISINRILVSETGLFSFSGQPSFLKKKMGIWTRDEPAAAVWTKQPPPES